MGTDTGKAREQKNNSSSVLWAADRRRSIVAMRQRGLSAGPIMLWQYLESYGMECWPRRRTIAADLDVSTDTIDRWLASLIEAEVLELVPRRRNDGSRTSNLYRLIVPEPARVEHDGEASERLPSDDIGVDSDTRNPSRNSAATPLGNSAATPPAEVRPHDSPNESPKETGEAPLSQVSKDAEIGEKVMVAFVANLSSEERIAMPASTADDHAEIGELIRRNGLANRDGYAILGQVVRWCRSDRPTWGRHREYGYDLRALLMDWKRLVPSVLADSHWRVVDSERQSRRRPSAA